MQKVSKSSTHIQLTRKCNVLWEGSGSDGLPVSFISPSLPSSLSQHTQASSIWMGSSYPAVHSSIIRESRNCKWGRIDEIWMSTCNEITALYSIIKQRLLLLSDQGVMSEFLILKYLLLVHILTTWKTLRSSLNLRLGWFDQLTHWCMLITYRKR